MPLALARRVLASHVPFAAARAAVVALGGGELALEGDEVPEALAALAPLEVARRRVVLPRRLVALAAHVLVLLGDDGAAADGRSLGRGRRDRRVGGRLLAVGGRRRRRRRLGGFCQRRKVGVPCGVGVALALEHVDLEQVLEVAALVAQLAARRLGRGRARLGALRLGRRRRDKRRRRRRRPGDVGGGVTFRGRRRRRDGEPLAEVGVLARELAAPALRGELRRLERAVRGA
mmetsp:Transcript_24822/g.98533  ORF Transcript_24822/g.98533 Transcript_24822/m.98533 type:complete len:232 (-) Transcript_24822:661-1356(-)